MQTKINWEETSKQIEERLSSSFCSHGNSKMTIVDLNPQQCKPIFYCPESIRAHRPDPSSLFSISELLSLVVSEGKQQESLENTSTSIIVEDFFVKLKQKLHSKVDQVIQEISQKILKTFALSSDILDFFHDFSSGSLNDDLELFKRTEKIIKRMSKTEKQKTNWPEEGVRKVLQEKLAKTEQIAAAFHRDVLDTFELLQKTIEGDFPILKSLKLVTTVLNNNQEKEITRGHGIDCCPLSHHYVSLGASGILQIRNILDDSEIATINVAPNEGHPYDSCKLSPNGKLVGVATLTSKNIRFFEINAGKEVLCFLNTHRFKASSCFWLNDDYFAVGYEDGLVKVFSIVQKKLVEEIKISVTWITALEVNEGLKFFVIDDEGSLHLVDLGRKAIEWSVISLHKECHDNKYGLKQSYCGEKIVTTGHCDNLVKMTRISDRTLIWSKHIGSLTRGVFFVPGDRYIVVLGEDTKPKIVVLTGEGEILVEVETPGETKLRSLALNPTTKHVLVGDSIGRVHKFEIVE